MSRSSLSARPAQHQSMMTADVARADAAHLVRAAQAGDRSAFGELYRRYAGMVCSIARARLSADEAADAAQEAFLRALSSLRSLRHGHMFGTWIAAISRNIVTDGEREHAWQATRSGEEPRRPGSQDDEFQAGAALRAIRSLPAAYRETLTLRLVEGMTGPEIAERTGMSPGSVRVNLHRGMK